MEKKLLKFAIVLPLLLATHLANAQEPAPIIQTGEWQKAPEPAGAKPKADVPAWLQYNSPYAKNVEDAATSNMNGSEITAWAQEAISDVLSFSADGYTERLTGFKKYFAVSGWQGYSEFLVQNNLPAIVSGEKYALNAIISEKPVVIREGAVDGVYRWLIKASAVLSFSQTDKNGQNQSVPATTRKVSVIVQFARQKDSNPAGVVIESWKAADAPDAAR